jgi:hypothetical protein
MNADTDDDDDDTQHQDRLDEIDVGKYAAALISQSRSKNSTTLINADIHSLLM